MYSTTDRHSFKMILINVFNNLWTGMYSYIVTIQTYRYALAQEHYALALHFKITLMIEMEYN